MVDIIHRIGIKAPTAAVYAALSTIDGLAGWWTTHTSGESRPGTDIVFALSHEGDYAIVRFGHMNWREAVEFTAHCSMKWATFLLSLRDLVETGTGSPAPNDLKIDNWN